MTLPSAGGLQFPAFASGAICIQFVTPDTNVWQTTMQEIAGNLPGKPTIINVSARASASEPKVLSPSLVTEGLQLIPEANRSQLQELANRAVAASSWLPKPSAASSTAAPRATILANDYNGISANSLVFELAVSNGAVYYIFPQVAVDPAEGTVISKPPVVIKATAGKPSSIALSDSIDPSTLSSAEQGILSMVALAALSIPTYGAAAAIGVSLISAILCTWMDQSASNPISVTDIANAVEDLLEAQNLTDDADTVQTYLRTWNGFYTEGVNNSVPASQQATEDARFYNFLLSSVTDSTQGTLQWVITQLSDSTYAIPAIDAYAAAASLDIVIRKALVIADQLNGSVAVAAQSANYSGLISSLAFHVTNVQNAVGLIDAAIAARMGQITTPTQYGKYVSYGVNGGGGVWVTGWEFTDGGSANPNDGTPPAQVLAYLDSSNCSGTISSLPACEGEWVAYTEQVLSDLNQFYYKMGRQYLLDLASTFQKSISTLNSENAAYLTPSAPPSINALVWGGSLPIAGSTDWVAGNTVQYAFTWLWANGTESQRSPWFSISLTYFAYPTLEIPVIVDPYITGVNIYRTFNGGSSVICVGTITSSPGESPPISYMDTAA